MSRSVSSRSPLHLLLQLCALMILNAVYTDSFADHSLELEMKLDIEEIESYLSKLDLADVPSVEMMSAGFKCPISALPFGALKSDWSRLLLLREAQPDGSIIKQKLIRLMRILIIAYYQMEERFDVISRDKQATKKCLGETMATASVVNDNTSTPRALNESSGNNPSDCYNNCSRINPRIEGTTTKSSPSANVTAIPARSSHQLTSWSDLNAKANYSNVTFSTQIASRILDNCIKLSSKDKRTGNNIYENLRNKARHSATRGGNEVYVRSRSRISPAAKEFWRYVTLPAPAPFTIPKRAYRMQRLNWSSASPGKSRKRSDSSQTSACSYDGKKQGAR